MCSASRRLSVISMHTVLGLIALVLIGAVHAETASASPVSWGEVETIDQGDLSVSSGSSSSMVFAGDIWHMVYSGGGGIYYTRRAASGWTPPVVLALPGSGARNPHLSQTSSALIAVWEAPRGQTAHEVWCRVGMGDSWGPASFPADDGICSRNPVVARHASSLYGDVLVAWEDSTAAGWRVRCSLLMPEGWGPVETLGNGASDARDPAIATLPSLGIILAWSDWRGGNADIYTRTRDSGGWDAEQLMLDRTSDCRHPVVRSEVTGDMYWPVSMVLCESQGLMGATEIIGMKEYCPPGGSVFSQDDGVPSTGPALGAHNISAWRCGLLPSSSASYLASWTDHPIGRYSFHRLGRTGGCTLGSQAESLQVQASPSVALNSREDNPEAEILQAWTDLEGGTRYLRARIGHVVSCIEEELQALTPVLIAPEGTPATILRFYDQCSGQGSGGFVELMLYEVDDQITWDPEQSHPTFWGESDPDGYVVFPIRGGGCAMGPVYAYGGTWCEAYWPGVKSPDVDGDCMVAENDLNYVEAHLGTNDFCADLDGSGLVGPEDVAIVQETLGDHCSHVSGLESGSTAGVPRLGIHPNPCREAAWIRLEAPPGSPVDVRVFDASGRLVRTLQAPAAGPGMLLRWDLRDEAGRALPSGMYFAAARAGGRSLRAPLLIVR